MRFSLRQISVFDAVARLGSVSRAAEEVALSQSAASMALKDLEESLGTTLFHRQGRKLVLNENGRRLQPQAHSLILLASEIGKPQTEELEGTLRVAASPTVANYVMPQCSAAFLAKHPRVRLELSSEGILDTADRVEAMSVDLGLLESTCTRTTLLAETVARDQAVVFASPVHPLARQERVTLADLQAASWCLREIPSVTRTHLNFALGGVVRIRFSANTNEAVKAVVAAGVGLGFASTRTVQRELAAGELVELQTDLMPLDRSLTLLVPKKVYQGALPKAFAEHAKAWFAVEGALP